MLGRWRRVEEKVGYKSLPLSINPPTKSGSFLRSAGHNLIWVPALYLTISQLLQVSRTSPFWCLNNPFKGNLCTPCPQCRWWLVQRLLCEAEFGPWFCFWIRMLDIRRQLSMATLCSEHVKALLRRTELQAIKLSHPTGSMKFTLFPHPANRTQRDSESFLFVNKGMYMSKHCTWMWTWESPVPNDGLWALNLHLEGCTLVPLAPWHPPSLPQNPACSCQSQTGHMCLFIFIFL